MKDCPQNGRHDGRAPRRVLFVLLGSACVALGAVGAVVPGLPTTVFLLIASYFFARSCPEMNRRLLEHPRLGPYMKMAVARVMPRRAKVAAIVAMWAGVGLSWLTLPEALAWLRYAVLVLGVVGTGVVWFHVATMRAQLPSGVSPAAAERSGPAGS